MNQKKIIIYVKNRDKSSSGEEGRIVLNICNEYTSMCRGGFWISRKDISICMYGCIIYKYISIDRIKSKEGSGEYINDKLSLLFIISNG